MKKLFFLAGLALALPTAWSQTPCSLQGFASPQQISCGQSVTLSAFGNGSGNVAFQENFNSGSPVGWQFTQTVTIANNTCGRPAPDGSNFMWMGDASVNPRDMTTVPFDLSLGGTICFEMRYSIQGDASPCEGPDEPQEGVYLQYSTNGGANWTNIEYWDPNGGNDPQLVNWNQYCMVIPPGARTTTTMIRWHQDNVSGAEYDHWGIDNVVITLNDPNFVISWLHDNYSYGYGSSGGNNPTQVTPLTTTTYNVQITDGTTTCTDAVQVVVTDPVIVVNAGRDTTICPGECVTIDADAYWQIEPAGPRRFVNDISQTISASPGGGSIDIPISVAGLNIGAIQQGSILEVCITNMSYFGFNIFPPSSLTVGAFAITLKCPSGGSITLVPAGVTTSTAILPGYVQTCFTMSATGNIAAGAPPYTGTFAPNQPLDNLAGCTANGNWIMSLTTTSLLGFGSGNFDGWSITFDDPGLTGPVTHTWSPTVNMTNETTLNPTVCPPFTSTYTLTATNHPGCRPASDDITITVPANCCQLQLDAVQVQQPSCTTGGQINIQVSGQGTGLRYSIDNGVTYQASGSFLGLAAGTYYVLVNDDNNCPVGRAVTLSNGAAPVLDNVAVTPGSCTGNTGSISITASGGTAPLSYSIDNGATSQASGVFNNLATGTYTIVVTDHAGCSVNGSAQVQAPNAPVIGNVAVTDPTCGQADGSITVTATGTGLQYSIDGGTTYQASGTFNNVGSGSYTVTVQDNAGCTATATATVNDLGAPVISAVNVQNIPCGGGEGIIRVVASGSGTLQYSIDNGATFQPGNQFNGLSAGTYNVVVESNGCRATATATITGTPGFTVQTTVQADGCQTGCTGSVSVQVTGGSMPFSFAWANNAAGNVAQATALCAGTYNVTVTDASGCTGTATAQVTGEPGVDADFTFNPSEVLLPNGIVNFHNESDGADQYFWSFAHAGSSTEENPIVDFGSSAPGSYIVCLRAVNAAGCEEEACKKIVVKDDLLLFVPNAFTPNGNSSNETFFPVSRNILFGDQFEFTVFSRWGETMFHSSQMTEGWDGTYRGKAVPPDVYVWKLKINYPSLPEKILLGHVSVIR